MIIREATVADVPRITELSLRSLVEGPYREQVADNPERVAQLALDVIERHDGRILVADEEGRLVGLLAFIIFPHHYSGEITAGELIWYVEPTSRPGGIALKLFWQAQDLARALGAKRMQFTAPTREIGAIYKRFGYTEVETTYQRTL